MLSRRQFLAASALAVSPRTVRAGHTFDLASIERPRVLKLANKFLYEPPITITASHSPRSAGGIHDYFSEGDYWWPDPKNPSGPYIQRDGETNPDNFVAHRQALMRLSVQCPALCAAWVLSKERKYADHAVDHLRAWFIDPATVMNPNLQFAQAIHGRTTGRGTGIIDTLQLIDVVRGAAAIEFSGALSNTEQRALRKWFADYLLWMTTSKNGIEERDAKNNHGTCWCVQAAVFAGYTRNPEIENYCRNRFKTVLIPNQMASDGSFPQELRRTKPYSYSLFNLEAMAGICQTLSTSNDNLWTFTLPDGRCMAKAEAFMFPYIADKTKWPYPPDVMYFDQWPLREQSLLFAGLALNKPEYLDLWRTLNEDPTVEEAIRNYPIRQPVLWMNPAIDRDVSV
ncbi:MAG TPA: alginate lyase family protein [Bryobacteraceae bacterium]|nr:alginate lyase family protein [Bryobacteraceae bacterium]